MFIKRSIVERTKKAEIRPKEQSEKVESRWENLWNEIQFERAIKTETDTRIDKKEWASSVGLCQRHQPQQRSSVVNTELKGSSFKTWSRSVYNHTCYAYCQGFLPYFFLPFRSIHLDFFKTSPNVFLC